MCFHTHLLAPATSAGAILSTTVVRTTCKLAAAAHRVTTTTRWGVQERGQRHLGIVANGEKVNFQKL
jgi:hypothetical protein